MCRQGSQVSRHIPHLVAQPIWLTCHLLLAPGGRCDIRAGLTTVQADFPFGATPHDAHRLALGRAGRSLPSVGPTRSSNSRGGIDAAVDLCMPAGAGLYRLLHAHVTESAVKKAARRKDSTFPKPNQPAAYGLPNVLTCSKLAPLPRHRWHVALHVPPSTPDAHIAPIDVAKTRILVRSQHSPSNCKVIHDTPCRRSPRRRRAKPEASAWLRKPPPVVS